MTKKQKQLIGQLRPELTEKESLLEFDTYDNWDDRNKALVIGLWSTENTPEQQKLLDIISSLQR